MKKLLALLVLIVLLGSLLSCSGEETKDNLLENISECNLTELWKDFESNHVSAQDKYYGKIIKITGYVKDIYPNYATVYPINAPVDEYGFNRLYVKAYFSKDDMKQISTNSVINCTGKISSVFPMNYSQSISLNEALYIDDTIELQGNVSFLRDNYSKNRIMRISSDPVLYGEGLVKLVGDYQIKESDTQGDFYSITIDNKFVQDGDYIKIRCKLEYVSDGSVSESAVFYNITEIYSVG